MKILKLALICWLLPLGNYTMAAETSTAERHQYTFSWQFVDESTLSPRGGTTKGNKVKLDETPSPQWRALQVPGLSKFERDRRAILAMAGEYRASFDFIEVAGFTAGFRPDRPYQSWGTEKVYVLEDKGNAIVLQRLLAMSIVDAEGKVQGPFVTKHWRQDWQYEPANQLVYRGHHTWQLVDVPAAERKGTWRQTVYQVDDSPRYSGVARWQHTGNFSSWSDAEVWRPLPRREYSVRNDYDVLIGSNTHIITPTGWLHEQQNLKTVLNEHGKLQTQQPIVAREFGLNRYERIRDFDWSAGDQYIQATRPVWDAVRVHWDQLIAERKTLRLKGAPDKDQLFIPLYAYADDFAANPDKSPQQIDADITRLVGDYLLESQ